MPKIVIVFLVLHLALVMLSSCESSTTDNTNIDGDIENTDSEQEEAENDVQYIQNSHKEQFRPQLHFSPEKGWMNDPNGLVYLDGEYHLFYQYKPEGFMNSKLHWGHAVSKDLVTWEELPIALFPSDELGSVYSGSAIIENSENNELCKIAKGDDACMVAIFTHTGGKDKKQKQSVAVSRDKGRTFTEHKNNPVLQPSDNIKDFRDPKVFYYKPIHKWIMVLAAGNMIKFFSSVDLVAWQHESDFTKDANDKTGVWECPDLFQLDVENESDKKKWILQIDLFSGGLYGDSGAKYFVGEFDGTKFIADNDETLYVDHGQDFYATQSFSNTNDKRYWIAWMNNWSYALGTPTEKWQGAMSLPRSVSLDKTENSYRLRQKPVEALKNLRIASLLKLEEKPIENEVVLLNSVDLPIEIEAEITNASSKVVGLTIKNSENEQTTIGYDFENKELFVDRTNSGKSDFSDSFAGIHKGNMANENGKIKLKIYIDTSSVEVFGNDGETVITDLIFPNGKQFNISAYSESGTLKIEKIYIFKLRSIWAKPVTD